jgi:hypothetical protein
MLPPTLIVCTPDDSVASQMLPQTVSELGVAAARANWLEGQVTGIKHDVAANADQVPKLHVLQLNDDDAPATEDQVPALQLKHLFEVAAAIDEYVPALQFTQKVAPNEDDHVPEIQLMHD